MTKRLKCPFCFGMFREKADGTITKHGARGARYPDCGDATESAYARCTACWRIFADVEGFTAHRYTGTCLHPSGLGYVDVEGIWTQQ